MCLHNKFIEKFESFITKKHLLPKLYKVLMKITINYGVQFHGYVHNFIVVVKNYDERQHFLKIL